MNIEHTVLHCQNSHDAFIDLLVIPVAGKTETAYHMTKIPYNLFVINLHLKERVS